MSIFKHSTGEAQQTTTAPSPEKGAEGGQPEPQARLTPPFVSPAVSGKAAAAPGVVPPPAAPVYSMRPPEPAARMEAEAESAVAESLRRTREAQVSAQLSVQERLGVAVRAARSAAPAAAVRRRAAQQPAPASPRPAHRHHHFDPMAYAQAGLLNLAWRWQEAGSPIRAIHTYMELLARYPGTPAAAAAIADLVELSNKLAEQGNFHTALSIFDDLEHLQRMLEEE